MDQLEKDFELVFELFCEWYRVRMPRFGEFSSFNETKFFDLWDGLWFAKNAAQVDVDERLKKYSPLFDRDPSEFDMLVADFKHEQTLIWKISWLLLWDQISRNIFRRSAKAYATDGKARQLVEEIMPFWEELHPTICASLTLVFIHSEDAADLQK